MLKEWNVLVHEFWYYQLTHRVEQNHLLFSLWRFALLRSRSARDGDDERTQSVIIVILLTKLLLTHLHDGNHFLCQWLGVCETFAEEHDFGDEAKVGNHHRDWAHDSLQIIWQLCTTGVPRIHRYKNST